MNNPIAICFAINNSYCEQTIKIIRSIIINSNSESIKIYVLFNNLNAVNKTKITNLQNDSTRLKISLIEISKDIFNNTKITIPHTSIETYFRLLIPSIFKNIEDKILYLDADIVIRHNIDELWNTEIQHFCLAGVEDVFIKKINYKNSIGLFDDDVYVNAGVLLFNVKRINKLFGEGKIMLSANKINESKKINYQDQDVINIIFKGKIKKIDNRFNLTMADIRKSTLKIIENASIIHYTGSDKPWNVKNPDTIPYKYYFTETNNIKKISFRLKKEDYNGYRHYSWLTFTIWRKKLK